MLDMAIYRAPRAPRIVGRRVLSPTAQQCVAEALRLLCDGAPGLVGDEAWAEHERVRIEDEARGMKQAVLPLVCAPAPCEGVKEARVAGSVDARRQSVCSGSPVDGSSLETPVAGNSDPASCVDSGRGSY